MGKQGCFGGGAWRKLPKEDKEVITQNWATATRTGEKKKFAHKKNINLGKEK